MSYSPIENKKFKSEKELLFLPINVPLKNSKSSQIEIRGSDVEAEESILWPSNAKN